MFVYLLLPLLLCWCVPARKIPSFVHLCNRNDPEVGQCFINTVNEIMPYLTKGIPEMGIPPIDPLGFDAIKVDTGKSGSVNVVMELINGTVSGLKNLKLKNHVMDFDKVIFSADLEIPHVEIKATYTIRGTILLFELDGGGLCSFNATDIKTKGVWTGSTYKKKNKTHINIDKIEFKDLNIENIRVRLNNLFPDNVGFTDNVNNAINDNLKTLRRELEPIITDTLSELLRKYFNGVYDTFSIDRLYPSN